jgi:hypothetical protein
VAPVAPGSTSLTGRTSILLHRAPHLDLCSLSSGSKIGSTPEFAGLIATIARQINCLRSRYLAPSGTVLREAGRHLRERAGRGSLRHDGPPSFHFASCVLLSQFSYCRYRIWRTTSTIKRWGPPARRCIPVSERGSPATPAPQQKTLHALVADVLSEPGPYPNPSLASGEGKGGGVFITVDGERHKMTKREAVPISWSTNPPPICGRPRCCST